MRWWRPGCELRPEAGQNDVSRHHIAEAEGNRTPLTEVLGHNGFEDRAAHQDGYASSGSPVMLSSM
jgi:hypothetical protein